jgi:hypothetical protein
MARSPTSCLFLTAALARGCLGAPPCHNGKLVAEFRPGDRAGAVAVPYAADYAMFRWPAAAAGGHPEAATPGPPAGQPWAWRGLLPGDRVGFERGADRQLLAVAGPEKIPLPDGRYCWHITPETEYRGLGLVRLEAGEVLRALLTAPGEAVSQVLFLLLLLGGAPGWG